MLGVDCQVSRLYVSGSNAQGQTGLSLSRKQFVLPRPCNFGKEIIQISCGFYHTLMLGKEGLVYQSGGQNSTPALLDIKNIIQIAAGGWHNLAQSYDLKLFSWGRGENGQLGLNSQQDQLIPKQIKIEQRPYQFALGGYHSFIWNDDETLSCGKGTFGQLGLGNSVSTQSLTRVDMQNVKKVDCGESHTLLLDKQNKVWICGVMGQSFAFKAIEIMLPKQMEVVSICAGRKNSAIVGAEGELYIFDDKNVELVNIKTNKIRMRSDSYIIQDLLGNIYSWGKNNYGELGHGDIEDRDSPTLISQMDHLLDFDLGETHAVFLCKKLIMNQEVEFQSEISLQSMSLITDESQLSCQSDLYKEPLYFNRKNPNSCKSYNEKENQNPQQVLKLDYSSEIKLSEKDSVYTPEVSQYSLSIVNILKDKKIAELQLELSQKDEVIDKLRKQMSLMEAKNINHLQLIKDLQKK